MKLNLLWTDYCLLLMLLVVSLALHQGMKKKHVKLAFARVFRRRLAVVSSIILLIFIGIGALDSVHFNKTVKIDGKPQVSTKLYSLLDELLSPLDVVQEKTYSEPFALHAFSQETRIVDGVARQVYPRLHYIPKSIGSVGVRNQRITSIVLQSIGVSVLLTALGVGVYALVMWAFRGQQLSISLTRLYANPIRFTACLTGLIGLCLVVSSFELSREFHIFGTGKIGQDIFYYAIKSIRTGLIIGTLTTLFMLPLAVGMGIGAGFFGGWVDDAIQYTYTTLSSIPGVLLIAASILSMQIYIANHPEFFPTLALRADARLLALCVILGVTSWTSLCRLLRAESLKLREVDFVQAAIALGTSPFMIIRKHLLPNLMHIVVIAVVLDFSFLVLAEAVLSYVGVGVSPMTISWGNMINGARLELAREPLVWWPMLAAFCMMFLLVLASNLFADAIRDAFDPRNAV